MRAAILVSLAFVSGCAAQLGGGLDGTHDDGLRTRNVITVGGQLQTDRKAHSTASARVNMTAGLEDQPLLLKSVIFGIGMRFPPVRPPPLGFGAELGVEGGPGAPTTRRFDGLGAYIGARASLLYRVFGAADVQEGYSLAYYTIDLVPTLRGGTWGVPEGQQSRSLATIGEGGFELAVRFNFGSDLTGNHRTEVTR